MITFLYSLLNYTRYPFNYRSLIIFFWVSTMQIFTSNTPSLVHAQPIATSKDHLMTDHQHTRNDAYYWMRLTDEQKAQKKPDQPTNEPSRSGIHCVLLFFWLVARSAGQLVNRSFFE